jgi:hypothetical protein
LEFTGGASLRRGRVLGDAPCRADVVRRHRVAEVEQAAGPRHALEHTRCVRGEGDATIGWVRDVDTAVRETLRGQRVREEGATRCVRGEGDATIGWVREVDTEVRETLRGQRVREEGALDGGEIRR